jgi:hypothetical protein
LLDRRERELEKTESPGAQLDRILDFCQHFDAVVHPVDCERL